MSHKRQKDDELDLQPNELRIMLYAGERLIKTSYDEQVWAKLLDSIVYEEHNQPK